MAEREPRRFGAIGLWWIVFAIQALVAVGDVIAGQYLRASGAACVAVVVLILALSAGRPEPIARGLAVLFVILALAIVLSRFFVAPLRPREPAPSVPSASAANGGGLARGGPTARPAAPRRP